MLRSAPKDAEMSISRASARLLRCLAETPKCLIDTQIITTTTLKTTTTVGVVVKTGWKRAAGFGPRSTPSRRPDEEPRIADQAEEITPMANKRAFVNTSAELRLCWPALVLGFMAGV